MIPKLRSFGESDENAHNILGRGESQVSVEKRLQDTFGTFGKVGQTVKSGAIWNIFRIAIVLCIEPGLLERVANYSQTDGINNVE